MNVKEKGTQEEKEIITKAKYKCEKKRIRKREKLRTNYL